MKNNSKYISRRFFTLYEVVGLKQWGCSASLNHNFYIATDPTPVEVDHAAHPVGPTIFTHDDPPTLTLVYIGRPNIKPTLDCVSWYVSCLLT